MRGVSGSATEVLIDGRVAASSVTVYSGDAQLPSSLGEVAPGSGERWIEHPGFIVSHG